MGPELGNCLNEASHRMDWGRCWECRRPGGEVGEGRGGNACLGCCLPAIRMDWGGQGGEVWERGEREMQQEGSERRLMSGVACERASTRSTRQRSQQRRGVAADSAPDACSLYAYTCDGRLRLLPCLASPGPLLRVWALAACCRLSTGLWPLAPDLGALRRWHRQTDSRPPESDKQMNGLEFAIFLFYTMYYAMYMW